MHPPPLARFLIPRLPFFYGWVILGCVCLAGFARQGAAVAVLSIFVTPMTEEFGWSRTEISGAVSLGGVLAAGISPLVGTMLDRGGARLVLCLAVLGTGLATMALSLTPSLLVFYGLFCFARMNWAGPLDLGLYSALNSWFSARRARAMSIATIANALGLVALPLIAQFAMRDGAGGSSDWRAGWVAIGATMLLVGFIPSWLLLVRRPEDVGLVPDQLAATGTKGTAPAAAEPRFSRAQALRTSAFWLLAFYTALIFSVQAGVSLHLAPHLIERGLSPVVAATVTSVFSTLSAMASFFAGFTPRRGPVRFTLAVCGLLLSGGAFALVGAGSAAAAYAAAGMFGFGVGLALAILPAIWADYFGRASYGAIRGVALSLQVLAQASGPLISGILRDSTGNYVAPLLLFGGMAALSAVIACIARPPKPV